MIRRVILQNQLLTGGLRLFIAMLHTKTIRLSPDGTLKQHFFTVPQKEAVYSKPPDGFVKNGIRDPYHPDKSLPSIKERIIWTQNKHQYAETAPSMSSCSAEAEYSALSASLSQFYSIAISLPSSPAFQYQAHRFQISLYIKVKGDRRQTTQYEIFTPVELEV
ncbi:hypothetical protein Tco_1578469 [Tanacetum coccineum]